MQAHAKLPLRQIVVFGALGICSCFGAWLLVTCAAMAQGPRPPESKEMVEQVFAAWKALRTKFKSVRYEVSGAMITPKGSITTNDDGTEKLAVPVPRSDVSEPLRHVVLLDFVAQRFRFERDSNHIDYRNGKTSQRKTLALYDGKELWQAWRPGESGRPPSEPDATVMTGNLRETGFPAQDWPYFIAHGYVPTHENHLYGGRMVPKVKQKEFYLHGRTKHAGRECVVMRTELDHFIGQVFNEYWVDLARGGLLLRYLAFSGKTAPVELDIGYQEKDGAWLLAGWTILFRSGTQTFKIHRLRVDACEVDVSVSQDDFRFNLLPGMKLKRMQMGGNEDSNAYAPPISEQIFEVGARGALTPVGAKAAGQGYFWPVVIGGTLTALLVAGWWWRSRRNATGG